MLETPINNCSVFYSIQSGVEMHEMGVSLYYTPWLTIMELYGELEHAVKQRL